MTDPKDDLDRLAAGTLPTDPFGDTIDADIDALRAKVRPKSNKKNNGESEAILWEGEATAMHTIFEG